MDWGTVTNAELLSALREVDWKQRPRSAAEFFTRFTPPKSSSRLHSRVKCNVYYYRTNYILILFLTLGAAFARNPVGLVAIALMIFSILLLNNKFAEAAGVAIAKAAKNVSPQFAAAMRGGSQTSRGGGMGQIGVGVSKRGFGGGSEKSIIVFGIPRMYTFIILYVVSIFLIVKTSALVSLVVAYIIGLGLVGVHASMRSPNLKARLENAQQEFRAAWRGQTPDYTL